VRQILIKKDIEDLSEAAADLFVEIAKRSIAKRGAFSIALAGGSTPRALYLLLASRYRNAIDWTKVTFFIGDERNVPHDSPESNYRTAAETLFEPLSISDSNAVAWSTELEDPAEIAALHESSIALAFEASAETWINGLPRFDMILLGLGEDAHTASLFPHTGALRETKRLAVANWVDKLKDYRLTITFPVINNGANVMFLVSGANKAEAVANVLEGECRPDDFPAQRVNPESGHLYWLLDKAAAKRLHQR
jgi:6-phosphogluconolactonase